MAAQLFHRAGRLGSATARIMFGAALIDSLALRCIVYAAVLR
jgi:hypothetical protein